MPEPSIHHVLKEIFPTSNQADWTNIASQELAEKIPIKNLTWKVDGMDFYPYYEKHDVKDLAYLEKYHNHLSHKPFLPAGSWENLPKITVSDVKRANDLALRYLATGADGILFDITQCIDCNFHSLLEKIDWPYCNISFIAPPDKIIATKIFAYATQKNYDLAELTGSLFWNTKSEITDVKALDLTALKKFHAVGITIPPDSPIQEISKFLQRAVTLMDSMIAMGVAKESAFKAISVSFSSEENFFVTIAKLKAARFLWYQVSQAYEISKFSPSHLHVHVSSDSWVVENFQPHGNMIKNTAHALAAVLGGCNSLTLAPEAEGNEMMHRTARNVSNILKEESNIDKVADAVAGAYVLEKMVHELSQAAWKDFQNKIRP